MSNLNAEFCKAKERTEEMKQRQTSGRSKIADLEEKVKIMTQKHIEVRICYVLCLLLFVFLHKWQSTADNVHGMHIQKMHEISCLNCALRGIFIFTRLQKCLARHQWDDILHTIFRSA